MMKALLVLLALSVSGTAASRHFVGVGGLVRLSYPAGLAPSRDFSGRALMTGGWRLIWDGSPVGPGEGVVRFSQEARSRDGVGRVTEMVQVGFSRDARVVARCGTYGLHGGSTRRMPNRMLGGHRWTVWTNGDAGMSQQIAATDFRTVVDGTCYAIDRVSYAVKAAEPLSHGAPTQALAAARIDAVLSSVRVGRR